MAIKKFYSNKAKAGWRENPGYRPPGKLKKGKKQKEHEKKYYSWGYDLDLEPVEWDEKGKPKRNRKRESGFFSRDAAQAAIGRIRLAEKNKRYELVDEREFPLLSDLFQKRINTIADHAEKMRAVRVLQQLLDCLEENEYEHVRLNQLTTAMINLYVERRRAQSEKVKDETINRDLRVLRATLNQAKNLFSGLDQFVPPRVPFLKVDKSRREKVLHSVEVERILSQLVKPQTEQESEAVYLSRCRSGLLFALAAVTGARPGELAALREEDILFDMNVLKITGRKTRFRTAKTVRYFPLLPILRQILLKALSIRIGEYIFTQKGTLTPTFYENIEAACRAAGFKYGRKTLGGIIPYDLRHTATTLLMQSGADFETVSSLTGQSRHSLWHYTHASRDSIERAANVLGDFGEKFMEKGKIGLGLDSEPEVQNIKRLNATNTE